MRELLGDVQIDEQRLLTETAIFADKVAVDEETVRLRSHIGQFREILEINEPIGRKLDFLLQEINREINTIGSKSNDLDVARIVIDVKAEIEKLDKFIFNNSYIPEKELESDDELMKLIFTSCDYKELLSKLLLVIEFLEDGYL